MKSAVIIATICALFVTEARSAHFCSAIKDNAENLAILESCFTDNYPPSMLNLVSRCYRLEFDDSEGTWLDFITKVQCDFKPEHMAKYGKFEKCVEDEEDEVYSEAGLSVLEDERGALTQRCVSEKLEGRPSDYHLDEFVEEIIE